MKQVIFQTKAGDRVFGTRMQNNMVSEVEIDGDIHRVLSALKTDAADPRNPEWMRTFAKELWKGITAAIGS